MRRSILERAFRDELVIRNANGDPGPLLVESAAAVRHQPRDETGTLLHGIGSEEADSPIHVDGALKADPGARFEMVLTNPPFGRKSSMTVVNAEGEKRASSL